MRAALLVAGLLAACGDDGGGGIDASTTMLPPGVTLRDTIMEDVPLQVNEIVEAILVGGPGDAARITMSAGGAPIDWNMHGHANGETQVVTEEFAATNIEYVFVPPAQADWYVLIRNKGQTNISVQLTIELYDDITWSGWQ
jgi:hypothetical protein